jgi:hypothetical protein
MKLIRAETTILESRARVRKESLFAKAILLHVQKPHRLRTTRKYDIQRLTPRTRSSPCWRYLY